MFLWRICVVFSWGGGHLFLVFHFDFDSVSFFCLCFCLFSLLPQSFPPAHTASQVFPVGFAYKFAVNRLVFAPGAIFRSCKQQSLDHRMSMLWCQRMLYEVFTYTDAYGQYTVNICMYIPQSFSFSQFSFFAQNLALFKVLLRESLICKMLSTFSLVDLAASGRSSFFCST